MIAENNTWIFGEINLTVDDQLLPRRCASTATHRPRRPHRRARQTYRRKVGIVDLKISRAVPRNHPDEREHLMVELKRPSVKIGQDEISQIEEYAFTIAEDQRFAT